jgi:3-isopropylmalate/(R)-2-methylmalate dehydratase small subunit
MEKFTTLRGVAAPLPMVNVDTDMIIPKNFLKTIKRTGLKEGLFYEMRWTADGQKKDFILDQPAYQNAKILVAGPNFGCGSSREHAPWALEDYGFRAIIAPSFADIFRSNCTKIGLLPVELPAEDVRAIAEAREAQVDLAEQEVRWPGGTARFDIDPDIKHRLLNGLDDIALSLQQGEAIDAYERDRERSGPVTTAL